MDIKGALDRSSSVPLHHQLRETLRGQLEAGMWRAGELLPTEQELCEVYGVSRTTARAALDDLVRQGLIYRERGRGTFATGPRYEETFVQSFGSFHQEMSARGHRVRSDVLGQSVDAASERIAHMLEVPVGTSVLQITRLRRLDGSAVVYSESFLPLALCPDVLDADLGEESLYDFIERTYGFAPARITRSVEALPMPAGVAANLDAEVGAAALHVESLARLIDSTPLEFSDAWYRGDKTKFEVEVIVGNQG